MAKLTDRACANTKPKASRDVLLGDGNGLYLRIRSGGSKVWIVDYLLQGKRKKVGVGNYDSNGGKAQTIDELLDGGILSLAQARMVASEWKKMRRAGRDAAAEREKKKADAVIKEKAESDQPTVDQAIDKFVAQHIDGKKSAHAVKYRLKRLSKHVGGMKIHEVTRKQIIDGLEIIAQGSRKGKPAKQLAGEVLTTAKRLWRFAESREWVSESKIERLKRADFDARPRKRDVVLSIDELAKIWQVLRDPIRCRADNVTSAALQLLILTGQRECEVCEAHWGEFDFNLAVWRIPADRTKAGRSHIVHLSSQALGILTTLLPKTGKCQHVFSSPKCIGQSIYGRSANNALLTLFKRGLLPDVTQCHVHDFRRTLITRLPELGFDPLIGNKIANHKLQGVLGHYNHAEHLSERKRALEDWAEWIERSVCMPVLAQDNSLNCLPPSKVS